MANDKVLRLLRAMIAARDLNKGKIAKELGISRSFLSLYLHGDVEMPENVRNDLFTLLGVDDKAKDKVLLSVGLGGIS